MKKYARLSLYLLLLAVLVGACTPASEPATDAPEADEPVVEESCALHVQGSARPNPGEEDAWDVVIAAFEEEYNCEVSVRWTGEWHEIPQQLETARMAGEPVDISSAGAALVNGTLARSGILMDLTELIEPFADRFAPGMLEPYTIADRVWGIPWGNASSSMFYYNKTLFDNLSLEEPQTYEDLVAVSAVIQAETDMLAMIHQGKAPWMWPMWFFETFAQTSGNESVAYINEFLAGNQEFPSTETQAAFEAIKQFYDDGILTQESLDTDSDGMLAAFAQQRAAFFYGGLWELARVKELVGDSFEVGIFEFPLVVDDPSVVSQHGGGPDGTFVIPSFIDPANLKWAVQFLEFITRPEHANTIISTESPFMPTVSSVPPVDDPLAEELTAEFLPHTITFLDWIWPVEVNDAVLQAIPAVLVGEMTPEEASASVQAAYDRLVEETEYQFDWWNTWSDDDWDEVTPQEIPEIEVGG